MFRCSVVIIALECIEIANDSSSVSLVSHFSFQMCFLLAILILKYIFLLVSIVPKITKNDLFAILIHHIYSGTEMTII